MLAVFSAPCRQLHAKAGLRISTSAVFLWARVDYASRAAKNSPLGCFCPFFCDGAAAVRIRPHENPNFLQTENRQRISTLTVFLWARVDYASRAAKNSPPGCFCPFFCDGAAAVRIHPPSLREGYYKTETPVPGSDTGVLGGRGWIRTSSTITIRWMRFEIVMDSCAFFEFHRKSIIGYHNHLGIKTGYKVGYFARGEYSARASETAIAAVSALPSTA